MSIGDGRGNGRERGRVRGRERDSAPLGLTEVVPSSAPYLSTTQDQDHDHEPYNITQWLGEYAWEGEESLLYPLIMAEILAPPIALRRCDGILSPFGGMTGQDDSDQADLSASLPASSQGTSERKGVDK